MSVIASRARVAHALGLERNIVAVSVAIVLLALGENLWKRFLPKYLETLSAPVTAIGLFGTCEDFLDGIYQMTTAIASYLPVARFADRVGRKPFVIATLVAFALFPIAVVFARSFTMLVLAFVVGGLREVGEPARKALIVDLVQPTLRARSIGLYYLVRSLAIVPAAFIGGLLWARTPSLPFWVAGAIGVVGVVVFTATVEERYAG